MLFYKDKLIQAILCRDQIILAFGIRLVLLNLTFIQQAALGELMATHPTEIVEQFFVESHKVKYENKHFDGI